MYRFPEKNAHRSLPFVVFIFFTLLIAAVGYSLFLHQKEQLLAKTKNQLLSIADLRAHEINFWHSDQLQQMLLIQKSPRMAELVEQFFANPQDAALRETLQGWLKAVHDHEDYDQTYLLDLQGHCVLSYPKAAEPIGPSFYELLAETRKTAKPVLTDLHRSDTNQKIHMNSLIPLVKQDQTTASLTGFLSLWVNPDDVLYPLLKEWPFPSETGETLLVRRDGDKVLFLNELRHQRNTALTLTRSVHDDRLPAAMAVQGREGIVEGIDYRGIPVMTAIRHIESTPWYLIAKIDQEEIQAPIRLYSLVILLLFGGLIALAALALTVLWRGRDMQYLRRQLEAERQRLALQHRYELFTRYANDIIFLLDEQGNIIDVNDRMLATYGYSREELLKMTIHDLRAPETDAQIPELIQKIIAESGVKFETVHRRKDGSRFPVEVSARLITIEGKKYLQSINRDITERKQAEDKLLLYQKAVDISGDLMAVTDAAFTLQMANDAYLRYYDLPREQAPGRAFPEIVGPEVFDRDLKANIFACFRGETIHYRSVRTFPTLGERHLDVDYYPLKGTDGQISLVVGIMRDVTEQVTLQSQLRQSQKMEAIGRLAGGVAHDFNNLLTAIAGYGQLVQHKLGEGSPLLKDVNEILRAADRASSLTQQLLAFSRKQVLQPKVLDLNLIVQDMEKMLRRLIGEDIRVNSRLSPDIDRIKADPGQLEQVLVNLAVNARDAMSHGGTLTLETSNVTLDEHYAQHHPGCQPGRHVMLAVSDTGCGMSPEIQARIFEPFFTTKELGKGTGLGLSTVYGIIKQSGGNIWVYSEPGKGSTFKIYLPSIRDQIGIDEVKSLQAAIHFVHGTETILLAEDDESVRKLTVDLLEQAGYKVLEAQGGEHALRICAATSDPIHLLVTDVIMPRLNGRELAQRARDHHPELKVLFVSGYTEDAISQHGVLAPETNFLQKPFSLQQLTEKIREVLSHGD